MEKCPRHIGKREEKDADYIPAIFGNLWGVYCWGEGEFYFLL